MQGIKSAKTVSVEMDQESLEVRDRKGREYECTDGNDEVLMGLVNTMLKAKGIKAKFIIGERGDDMLWLTLDTEAK